MIFRVWNILYAKSVRRAAPLLHRRFVLFFSLAAVLPAILVGTFSSSIISRNVNDVFGEDVKGILNSSYDFLNNYVGEELRGLGIQVLDVQRFLEANRSTFDDRISYTYYLQLFSRGVDVDAIYVINREGVVFSRVESAKSPDFKIPESYVFDYIDRTGRSGVQTQDDVDYLIGLTKLKGYEDIYLMVGQYLTSNVGVLSSLTGIQDAKNSLVLQQEELGNIRKIFLLTFVETVLLILIAAMWIGAMLAGFFFQINCHAIFALFGVPD